MYDEDGGLDRVRVGGTCICMIAPMFLRTLRGGGRGGHVCVHAHCAHCTCARNMRGVQEWMGVGGWVGVQACASTGFVSKPNALPSADADDGSCTCMPTPAGMGV